MTAPTGTSPAACAASACSIARCIQISSGVDMLSDSRRPRTAKSPGRLSWAVKRVSRDLHDLHVLCLPAFLAFGDGELDRLSFLQRTESVRLNGGEVHEDILAVLAGDEAEALRVVKPLDCSLFHI